MYGTVYTRWLFVNPHPPCRLTSTVLRRALPRSFLSKEIPPLFPTMSVEVDFSGEGSSVQAGRQTGAFHGEPIPAARSLQRVRPLDERSRWCEEILRRAVRLGVGDIPMQGASYNALKAGGEEMGDHGGTHRRDGCPAAVGGLRDRERRGPEGGKGAGAWLQYSRGPHGHPRGGPLLHDTGSPGRGDLPHHLQAHATAPRRRW